MASVELATAYVSLVPTMKGAQGTIARELGSVDADGIGRDVGGRMGGGIAGTLKGLVGPAIAAAAAVGLGGFVAEAAAASDATDKFKSTMNFAGIDTSGIEAATAAAKSYADQTVYDLPTIQATMAQLASNGVDGYTELTQAAGNLNAVAGGNAETFKSVSRTLTQSAGAGKLMTEDWNMLADAIPGAAGPLKSALEDAGAYTGNFKDAMAAGEITSEEFQASLMKLGMDPIAVEAGKSVTTFEGAIGGLEATINSGLMGALDALKPAITGAINGVSAGLGMAFGWIGNAFNGLKDLFVNGDFTGALTKAFGVSEDSPVVAGLFTLRDTVRNVFQGISDFISGFTMPLDLAEQFAGEFNFMQSLGLTVRDNVEKVFTGISDFVSGWTMPLDLAEQFGGEFNTMQSMGITAKDGLTRAWEGIKGAFSGIDFGAIFGQLGTVLGPLIPQFLQLFSAVSPVQTIFQAIQPLLPQLLDVFVQLATVVGQSLGQALTALLPVFVTLQGVFISVFQQVLATALPVIVQLVTMLGQTFAQLLPIIVPIITTLAGLAVTLISQLMPIFMQLVSTVLPMVVTIFGAVLSAIGPLISMIAGLLIPIIMALMPVVVTVFGVIASIITSAMQIVMGIIQVVTGIISGNWSQVWEGISNIFSGIWNTIVSVVTGVLAIIGQVVLSGLGLVSGFVSGALGNIGSFFSDTWNNVVDGVSGMIGKVTGFFSGIGTSIVNAMGNVGSTLFDTGKNIIQGLIDGIGSMMGAIGSAVISIVPEAIRGPFEDLLGIHSPSRVFMGYGVNIGQGLINGIDGMSGRIASSVEGMVTVPAAQDFAVGSSGVSPLAAAGGFGGSMTLMVGGRAFDAYLTESSTATLQAADSNSQYMRRGRG